MTMLAEVAGAVIGTSTHRDSHEVEIADPAGKPIETMRIGNDSAGFAQLLMAAQWSRTCLATPIADIARGHPA
jgi:hypothetical protein